MTAPERMSALSALQRRVSELNHRDLGAARLALAIGVALCGLSFFLVNLSLAWAYLSLRLPGLPWSVIVISVNGLVAVLLVVDVRRHPVEQWVGERIPSGIASTRRSATPDWIQARLFLKAGRESVESGERSVNPLDPSWTWGRIHKVSRWAQRPVGDLLSERIAQKVRFPNALANTLLAGPRSLREALHLFATVRHRKRPEMQLTATGVVRWLESRGQATESELTAYVSGSDRRADGVVLALDLGLILEEKTEGGVLFRLPMSER